MHNLHESNDNAPFCLQLPFVTRRSKEPILVRRPLNPPPPSRRMVQEGNNGSDGDQSPKTIMRLAFWIDDSQPEKNEMAPPNTTKPTRRRVRFDLSQNQFHESTRPADNELDDLWYHQDDYTAFQQQTQALAAQIPNLAWFRACVCLYFSLRTECESLPLVPVPLLAAETIGLSTFCAACPMVADYRVRRQHLLQQIVHGAALAAAHAADDDDHVKYVIRQTSVLTSRAACRYAHAMAVAAVENEKGA